MRCKTSELRSDQHLVESDTSVHHRRHSVGKSDWFLKQLKSDKPPEIPMIVLESSPAEEESMEEEAAVAEGESSINVPPY